jgi:predicted regulator of Ras-like GTPase activity (Roadblock/LC7/MglB family)
MFGTSPNPGSEAQQAETLLAGLRDLDGIWGAFVLSSEGGLLLWDVPRAISEEMLDAVGPRLAVLRDALATGGGMHVDFLTLRYERHRLCVSITPLGILCVITTAAVNVAALRMALNVTCRRLDRLLALA